MLSEDRDVPEEVEYLVKWARVLHGRGGMGFSGANPLSYATIQTWATMMDVGYVSPEEVEALLLLDAAYFASADETDTEDEVTLPKELTPWPERKEK